MIHNTRKPSFVRRRTISLLVVCVLFAIPGCQPGMRRGQNLRRPDDPIRALWVTRWDFKSRRDIATIMDNSRRAGFNTVLFQVRGNGTALYRSKLEPWAKDLGGRDPGFDPLAVACNEAHRRGLELHAWVNVMPGWRGKKPPTDRRQLYWAHADWFWRDSAGRRQPLGWYNSLNPCYPEVRRYIVDVMHEIVGRYPVDGLHMDYVRFPNEWNESYASGQRVPDYPRDRRTLAMFNRATRNTPDSAPALWNKWRTDQVTQLVRDIRAMVSRVRPVATLSAAVGADPMIAKRTHFQDARRWLAEGLLDAVYPMNYASAPAEFVRRASIWSSMNTRATVVTGIMFDQRDSRLVASQLAQVRRTDGHFAAFAYNSLFERLDAHGRPLRDKQSANRAALRQHVIPQMHRLASRRP